MVNLIDRTLLIILIVLVILMAIIIRFQGCAPDIPHPDISGGADPDTKSLFVKIIQRHMPDRKLASLDLLDVGIGSGEKTLREAYKFRRVVGVEPNTERFSRANAANSAAGSPISLLVHGKLAALDEHQLFDVVRYSYSFHTLPVQSVVPALSHLRPEGVLIIEEPCMRPDDKADDRLNRASSRFDPKLWQRFLEKVTRSHQYLVSARTGADISITTDRRGNTIFALRKPKNE